MADDFVPVITLEYKDLLKALKEYDKQMPGIAKKLLTAVNTEAKKKIKSGFRSAGYKAHVEKAYGDAGYQKNLKSFANKDYSAKILMSKDAFHYKFLEFGTNHKTMTVHRKGQTYQVRGFSVPAHPILYPIANSIWKTNKATDIMEQRFQKEINKIMGSKNK